MNTLTKIIATLGPASESKTIISELIQRGVNIFRFNLKHSTLEWHASRIERVRECACNLNIPVGILIDLQGPEIRITIAEGELQLAKGERVILGKPTDSDSKGFLIDHPDIIPLISVGQRLVVDDGNFVFAVEQNNGDSLVLTSHSQGLMATHKSLNIPGVYFPLPVLTEVDRDAIAMGKAHAVDFVALSFVRQAQDIEELRAEMARQGLQAKIVAKLETRVALDQLEQIMEVSDALMVARGDLGIEISFEQVPYYQKIIINKCVERGIPVITATQMLESMIEAPMATRAEISDVANAVYDFTDATMLSAETASGKYPVQSVETMVKTCQFIERQAGHDMRSHFVYQIADEEEMICDAAYNLSLMLAFKRDDIGGFFVFTQTGRTARKLSRYRPKVPIYAFTPNSDVAGALTMSYAVLPIVAPKIFEEGAEITKESVVHARELLESAGLYDGKKHYIALHGDVWVGAGRVSTIRMVYPIF